MRRLISQSVLDWALCMAGASCALLMPHLSIAGAHVMHPSVSNADESPDDSKNKSKNQEKFYTWTGQARIISDITHKETFWPGSGSVRAASREEAMKMALEAMKAQGSIGGHVVDAHVSLTN